ncbi:MAG TPA: hypothetical protein VGW75_15725 [Solirubrobacteraceae bacterium]|jgi:hypothetical protein|nr:hypothetical protein [Solirubrobacteraceae bacterium]
MVENEDYDGGYQNIDSACARTGGAGNIRTRDRGGPCSSNEYPEDWLASGTGYAEYRGQGYFASQRKLNTLYC